MNSVLRDYLKLDKSSVGSNENKISVKLQTLTDIKRDAHGK